VAIAGIHGLWDASEVSGNPIRHSLWKVHLHQRDSPPDPAFVESAPDQAALKFVEDFATPDSAEHSALAKP
jgi:hypothetical protein